MRGRHMEKKYGKLINIGMWITIVLFVLRCVISWDNISAGVTAYELFGYAGEAIGLAVILTALYERKLWRYNPREEMPKLASRYVGTFVSTYDDVTRDGTLDIKQTLTTVSVIFSTKESKSRSLSASIDDILGEKQLTYCYINQPKSEFRHRSEIHYGTAILTISEDGSLKGQYFTDRKTLGDMEFVAEEE
jgi:hypothetical protein